MAQRFQVIQKKLTLITRLKGFLSPENGGNEGGVKTIEGMQCTFPESNENGFVDHFDKALLTKAKTEQQSFAFDLEHTRKEEVQKFNKELKNGWWFSNKVGWFLYMSNLLTLLGAFLYCSYK